MEAQIASRTQIIEDSDIDRSNSGTEPAVPEAVVLKGSDVVVKVLKEVGVDRVFGIQGGKVIALFDSLSRSDIKMVHCGQEGAAGHMAEGYAESSGKVGVVIATSGPGATNLATPMLDAYMDSVPLVAITGQVPANDLGTMAFQEGPVFEMMRKVTKKNYLVTHHESLARTLREAFEVARSERPGPVSVDITSNVWGKDIRLIPDEKHKSESSESVSSRADQRKERFRQASIEDVLEAVFESERPIIYAGGGVKISGASELLRIFSEKYKIPVIATLKALGCFPTMSPLYLGMPGMHGTAYATHALYNADFVLVIGSRIDDRVIQNPDEFLSHGMNGKIKVIAHIDIDPYEINKRLDPEKRGGVRFRSLPISMDAKSFLEEALKIDHEYGKRKSFSPWHEQIEAWKKEYPLP
ncbi:thiamine pyrophosphate-binding protein, partial [Candidatus Woesearchaeota archaeon]|nr:thiamine pyrophosphate-binding protein [Candidatus Woesearchaeota archaeon]